jgi:8-oxo-dGTP pyrophosphatase MutT (NUDIX family)
MSLQQAAVLLPIFLHAKQQPAELLLIQRAKTLNYHPGQLAFPGGKYELTDRDLAHTALREAEEEIGLRPEDVRIITQLPSHETVSGFCMTPFVGLVENARLEDLRRDPLEVDSIIAVPMQFLFEQAQFKQQILQDRQYANLTLQGRIINKRADVNENWYCWGATATILYQWVQNSNWNSTTQIGTPL